MMLQDIKLSHIVGEISNENVIISVKNEQSYLPTLYSIFFPNGRKNRAGKTLYYRFSVNEHLRGIVPDTIQRFGIIRDIKITKLHDILDEQLMMIKLGGEHYVETYMYSNETTCIIAMEFDITSNDGFVLTFGQAPERRYAQRYGVGNQSYILLYKGQ